MTTNGSSRAKFVQSLGSTPPEDEHITHTRFPWLDTINHAPTGLSLEQGRNGLERTTHKVPLVQNILGLFSTQHLLSLLRGYGRFILDLTGEETVLFLCAIEASIIGNEPWKGVVWSRISEQPQGEGQEYSLELGAFARGSAKFAQMTPLTDFALEIADSVTAREPDKWLANVGNLPFLALSRGDEINVR